MAMACIDVFEACRAKMRALLEQQSCEHERLLSDVFDSITLQRQQALEVMLTAQHVAPSQGLSVQGVPTSDDSEEEHPTAGHSSEGTRDVPPRIAKAKAGKPRLT